jgi:hypothetical protein
MTEKTMRERLRTARPAEVPIVCMYLVAAVFEGPPPPPLEITFGPGMTDLFNRADVLNGAAITITCHTPPARRKARKKRKGK